MITVIGLGLGREDTLTLGALKAMKEAERVVLQTACVPVGKFLQEEGIAYETLDPLYDEAADFEELLEMAVEFFEDREGAVFGILGSARNNAFVAELKKEHEIRLIPGVAQGEYALDLCGVSAVYAQSIAADDLYHAKLDGRKAFAVTEIDSPYRAADVALEFSRYYPYDAKIWFVKGDAVKEIPLCELDKQELAYDCAAVFPGMDLEERRAFDFEDLMQVMRRLRAEDGCPWDREQTHVSLRQYLLEESYEVMDAIDKDNVDMLYDELGDVLYQVAFHSAIGTEHAEFDETDVTTAICRKMIDRHTHVFGNVQVDGSGDVLKNWEVIKRVEKGEETVAESMRNITLDSPLLRASKIWKKAELAGMDSHRRNYSEAAEEVRAALAALEPQKAETPEAEAAAGDLLFAAVKLLRCYGLSGDVALNGACVRFMETFEKLEKNLTETGRALREIPAEELVRLWEKAQK